VNDSEQQARVKSSRPDSADEVGKAVRNGFLLRLLFPLLLFFDQVSGGHPSQFPFLTRTLLIGVKLRLNQSLSTGRGERV